MEIKGLEQILGGHIVNFKRVVKTQISRLTAPGENFGSTILRVDVIVEKQDGNNETLHLVAKMLPQLEVLQKFFNVQVTFKLESAFYNFVVPTLQEFQKERGCKNVFDIFPKFYGSRNNLEGTDGVDKHAVLVLENLKTSGFHNLNRHIGCNLATTELFLRSLAQFHAVPIALKLKKPDVFEKNIKKFMACFYPVPQLETTKHIHQTLDILQENEACKPFIPYVEKSVVHERFFDMNFGEPFATISHRDLWTNNFMVKTDEQKRVTDIKFVDFQCCSYASPVRDLLFFLFTSVQFDILKEKLDLLIQYYHHHFVKNLKELGCPTEEFSKEKFKEELFRYGGYELFHVLIMLMFVVLGEKKDDVHPVDGGDFPKDLPLPTKEQIPIDVKMRGWWTLLEFGRRNWLMK